MINELATLITAGIPLDSSLRMLQQHMRDRLAEILHTAHREVQAGKPLSAALATHDETFDALCVNMIRAGEASGALDVVLRRLAEYRERVEASRSALISALTYPAILTGVALLSLFVLMTFVIPGFVPMFEDAGATLPMLTRLVFGASELLQTFWWVAPVFAFGGTLYVKSWLASPLNRRRLDERLLMLPVLGELIRFNETARFARTLGTLERNGMPLLASLRLTEQILTSRVFVSTTARCISQVESGGRLSDTLRQDGVLPAMAIDLIAVGEESGQLGEVLEKAADAFDAKVQQRVKRLLMLVEPVLILGLGAIIALVIVAILMAMLGLNELIV
ncbi:MAG TPA: type II secretion system F family protein [Gammaproteobacteria bacterium]